MKGKFFAIVVSGVVGLGIFGLVVYMPKRYEATALQERTVYNTSQSDLGSSSLSFTHRAMTSITPRSTTSSLQNCYAQADEVYYDEWMLKCEEAAIRNKDTDYQRCLNVATTTRPKISPYRLRYLPYPSREECELIKQYNIFRSDCVLFDRSGKEATLKWQNSRSKCETSLN